MTQVGGDLAPAATCPLAINSSQMMPMVFCASLPPWPRLYAPADTSWSRRNQRSMRDGVARRNTLDTSTIINEPSTNPSNGETKMNSTVFHTPAPMSELAPALAITAPTMPPINACDELLGMPYHQVTRFQVVAPTRAPNTMWVSTTPGCTMPLPMVAATLRWKMKMATMLKNAANSTACVGFNTPVDTTVAMEFAASWKP